MHVPRFNQIAWLLILAAGAAAYPAEVGAAKPGKTSTNMTAGETSPRLIEFTLGQHRFALPSNYFVDERGPDFQGSVTLALLWPELTPYPPGNGYWKQTSGPMRHHGVLVSFNLVNVPIDSLPERYVTLEPGDNPNDPSTNIALRIRRPEQFGLEHYIADLQKVAARSAKVFSKPPQPASFYIGRTSDWFIGRDKQGRIRTVV